jgi:hypothetical protein
MNLLTNGFVNNYARLLEPPEQCDAHMVELGLKGFVLSQTHTAGGLRIGSDNGPTGSWGNEQLPGCPKRE